MVIVTTTTTTTSMTTMGLVGPSSDPSEEAPPLSLLSSSFHPNNDDADRAPPRSIFDPPQEAEDEELSDDEEDDDGWDTVHSSLGDTTWTTRDTRDTRDTLSTWGGGVSEDVGGEGDEGTHQREYRRDQRRKQRRRLRHKHPSSLNEVELRIQLWDSYRLARIILGTPIKSFSLRGKTILHSIRKVAEMKLELIRLQKEVEMSKVLHLAAAQQQQQQQDSSFLLDAVARTPVRPSAFHSFHEDDDHDNGDNNAVSRAQQAPWTPAMISPEKPIDMNGHHHEDEDDYHALMYSDDENQEEEDAVDPGMVTPRRHTSGRPRCQSPNEEPPDHHSALRQQPRGVVVDTALQCKYDHLQETHDRTMKQVQTQLMLLKASLENVDLPSESMSGGPVPAAVGQDYEQHSPVSSSGPTHNTDNNTEGDSREEQTQPVPLNMNDKKKKKNKNKTTKASKESLLLRAWRQSQRRLGRSSKRVNRAEDTMQAVATVMAQQQQQQQQQQQPHDAHHHIQTPEEFHLRTILAKPSNAIASSQRRDVKDKEEAATTTTMNPSEERKMLLQMVEQLMAQVKLSSQETKEEFDALQKQLDAYHRLDRSASPGDPKPTPLTRDADVHTYDQFQKRLQTARILHTLELETNKSKHIQQVVDLSGQLDAYQHQVDKQNTELQKWQKKYKHLEEMAVTPEEAKDVLKDLDNLPPQATPEEFGRVQAKVVRVLQRMAQLQTRQKQEHRMMQKTRQLAQAKEAETQYQLDDLKLQHELLTEDTQVPLEVWEKQLGTQRRAFEVEIKEICQREERRIREMELLEVELTDLAMLAVEIEDVQQECKDSHTVFSEELHKARQQMNNTTPMIEALRLQVRQVVSAQRKAIQDLKTSWKRAKEIQAVQGRLFDQWTPESPDERLDRREEELREAQAMLATREARIQELEAMVKQLQSS